MVRPCVNSVSARCSTVPSGSAGVKVQGASLAAQRHHLGARVRRPAGDASPRPSASTHGSPRSSHNQSFLRKINHRMNAAAAIIASDRGYPYFRCRDGMLSKFMP